MAHTLAKLDKLGKSDLATLVMDYQTKFDKIEYLKVSNK